ncbi:uncharacterized protein BT62DRAFT_1013529 [Guyanagaster necrorhizus]|uniref:DUF6534 domain-containing protein n=1 Tax=Guyanagaster necrorhizus TaxID=856835 RepID=A0A9P7VF02_9AGAR|nr:uncharacterized protein BT62DRAFT_1013529 [Guyanagaster necrorhizus MCA 3950]KAG7439726.1 hypothetical protein BT62DRAFT_1013529 [Guyanagaster necrorhizus MCA 3950]
MSAPLSKTYGAVAIGALCASVLSGAVAIQTILYYKFYPSDFFRVKLLVFIIWFLDICHTTFIGISIWDCFIVHFARASVGASQTTGDRRGNSTPNVPSPLLLCPPDIYARNWLLTCPILIAATLRLGSACVSTSEMIRLKTYSGFIKDCGWVFTLGLSMSSVADILITVSLFGLLQTSRTEAESINAIIDSLILYTFETGSLTCAGTIVDMALGIDEIESRLPGYTFRYWEVYVYVDPVDYLTHPSMKVYANSLLVTLNTRRGLRPGQTIYFARNPEDGGGLVLDARRNTTHLSDPEFAKVTELQINVERSVHCTTDFNLKMEPEHTTADGSESVAE